MNHHPAGAALIGGGLAAAAVGITHAAPALTTITPLRRRLLPGLSGVGRPDHIALTFDDGPDARSTPHFLRLLDQHQTRATFFLLGSMLQRNPTLGKELTAAGHDIGVHGWHHNPLINAGPRTTRDDITRARDLITDLAGQQPAWYRPPYGILTTAALHTAHRLDLTPILWTTWGRDWTRHTTPASVQRHVLRNLTPGGTILLHDSDSTSYPGAWKATHAALPALITTIHDRHLTIGPLADHGLPAGWRRRPSSTVHRS